MNYPFILKFSSITNLSDARFAAGAWADLIGFNFDPNHRAYLEPGKAKEICGWVNGPILCGEFAYQPVEWIMDFVSAFNLKAIQVPIDYPFTELFKEKDLKFIFVVDHLEKVNKHEHAEFYLTNELNIQTALQKLSDTPVFLDLKDLSLDVSDAAGISLSGVEEDKPGTRNHADWMEFLEYWEEEPN